MDRKSFSRLFLFNTTFSQSPSISTSDLTHKLDWGAEIDGQLASLQQEIFQ
ncbi:hypothetical protein NEAUS04_0944 [Nematocida ausubeli]|nr:hypothetical protein NEAUS07_1239 [Nematocida ausubeli]KAI5136145.1 hypothetical protein NEAUS06_1769 [Nematocida ausubeli]KAI5148534.1 hypothetical protein NEAUS05_1416 [Nematocida ausubeli]KAI5161220.1 hypothetical protein NEAUS03_1539 [Nematocida ausubeli]KAI5162216.1 hypothetical protein NEAUS04_0944 [Nematocida ausubeli]